MANTLIDAMPQGIRIPEIAVQVVLPDAQISEGVALIAFTQILGAAIFIQVGQNVFSNRLLKEVIEAKVPVNVRELLDQGITQIVDFVPTEYRDQILSAYSKAITQVTMIDSLDSATKVLTQEQTLYLALGLAAVSCLGAVLIPWRSVKSQAPRNQESAAVPEDL